MNFTSNSVQKNISSRSSAMRCFFEIIRETSLKSSLQYYFPQEKPLLKGGNSPLILSIGTSRTYVRGVKVRKIDARVRILKEVCIKKESEYSDS